MFDPRLIAPFCSIVAGPSQSGKSEFIRKFLLNISDLVFPVPEEIIYCFSEWQPMYDDLKSKMDIVFIHGLPDTDNLICDKHRLIIIDDLMSEIDDRVIRLFTKESHHRQISVVFISQNLFSKHKDQRTMNLNAHYIILFKNPRDGSQITHLASQMHPGKTGFLKEAYKLATTEPYGYLLIDLKQMTGDNFRLRTNIFPGENQIVFLPK